MTRILDDSVITVFERRPYWGPELQRQFGHTSIAVRECRILPDLMPATEGFRAALLVVDLDSSVADCLRWLADEFGQSGSRWPLIICGSEKTIDLEWIVRQAGATEFLFSSLSGEQFALLCRRLLSAG